MAVLFFSRTFTLNCVFRRQLESGGKDGEEPLWKKKGRKGLAYSVLSPDSIIDAAWEKKIKEAQRRKGGKNSAARQSYAYLLRHPFRYGLLTLKEERVQKKEGKREELLRDAHYFTLIRFRLRRAEAKKKKKGKRQKKRSLFVFFFLFRFCLQGYGRKRRQLLRRKNNGEG